MIPYLTCMVGCLIVIALITVYIPTVIIREMNKIAKLLQQIEANTRK